MSEEYNETESPLVSYSNRIQAMLMELSRLYTYKTRISDKDKQGMLNIIANSPPSAKEHLKPQIEELKSKKQMSWHRFNEIVGLYHDWLYDTILKEAFKIKPRITKTGKLPPAPDNRGNT